MVAFVNETWSDYDGDGVYGDLTADAGSTTITNSRSYEPGIGRVDNPLDVPSAEYYHTDLLGSTRMMSDGSGSPIVGSEAAYTAFGELVTDSAAHRFGYAGAYGYQAPTSDAPGDPYATDFPFLHVGARYYDPATGRFLQRDPIGIDGGFNVYEYVRNAPTGWVDPSGTYPFGGFPGMPGKPKPPKPPTPGPRPNPFMDLEKELRRERRIQAACYAGLLVTGGVEAAVAKSIVGGALAAAGGIAWIWEYAAR